MSADATIRRLRSDDAASFKAIRLEALKASPELLRSTFELEDKMDVVWFASRLEDAPVMGAFRDGELVGTAGFSIQQGEPNAHKGRLFGMYVRSSLRNLGLGPWLADARQRSVEDEDQPREGEVRERRIGQEEEGVSDVGPFRHQVSQTRSHRALL
jgi:GNAT superfamily N-acetyltransferase